MNIRTKYRSVATAILGILSLLATLASSAPRGWQNVQAASDVSLSMVADQKAVKAGQDITYTVTMTNSGPDDATFVDVAFAMPDSLQLVSISCDEGISPDGPFCEYSSLPAGTSVVSVLVATPQTNAVVRTRTITASTAILFENADAFDPNTSNNKASVKTKLIGRLP